MLVERKSRYSRISNTNDTTKMHTTAHIYSKHVIIGTSLIICTGNVSFIRRLSLLVEGVAINSGVIRYGTGRNQLVIIRVLHELAEDGISNTTDLVAAHVHNQKGSLDSGTDFVFAFAPEFVLIKVIAENRKIAHLNTSFEIL